MACIFGCIRLVLRLIFTGVLIVYVLVPTVTYSYPEIVENVVFLRHVVWPWSKYYNDFQYYGLDARRSDNFHLTNTYSSLRLGVWHLLPANASEYPSVASESTGEVAAAAKFQAALKVGGPAILYLHGNAGSRCVTHRVELYKRMLSNGNQVVAFDYRGYADSEGYPDEDGVANDARFMFESIVNTTNAIETSTGVNFTSNVIIWGHSLGTGITMRMVADLAVSGGPLPTGIILEAPFSSLHSAVLTHPISAPYRNTPLMEIFLHGLNRSNLHLASAKNLQRLCTVASNIRIVILHAADDRVIPVSEARTLYNAGLKAGCKAINYFEFPSELGYKHNGIFRAPELGDYLAKAFRKYSDDSS